MANNFSFTCSACGQPIPGTSLDTLGKRIKALRVNRCLTARELSPLVDISPSHLIKIERGKRNLTAKTLLKLSIFYQVSTDYILRGAHG